MKTKSRNKYLVMMACIVFALVSVFGGLMLMSPSVERVGATELSGNPAYPPNGNFDVTLQMDINGADATRKPETAYISDNAGTTTISTANNEGYRKRLIQLGALKEAYLAQAHNNLSDNDAFKTQYSLKLSDSSDIYNSFTQYVTVEKYGTAQVEGLIFNAHKYKKSPNAAYLSVIFEREDSPSLEAKGMPKQIPVYIKVEIDSTFVAAKGKTEPTFYLTEDIDGTAKEPIILQNNRVTTFDFSVFLSDGTTVMKPLSYKDSSTNEYTELKEPISTSADWYLYDVTNFAVTTNGYGSAPETIVTVAGGVADGLSTPSVTINTKFTPENIQFFDGKDINGSKADFWNAAHFIVFTLRDGSGKDVSLAKRVYFSASGAPVVKEFTMPTELNYSSAFQFVDKDTYTDKGDKTLSPTGVDATLNDISSRGVSQVRVKPEYLCDYPSNGTMSFRTTSVNISGNSVRYEYVYKRNNETGEEIQNEIDFYLITATGKGRSEVTFNISYREEGGDFNTLSITVLFNVYGQYDQLETTIGSKKTKTFSVIGDSLFAAFNEDSFQLSTAVSNDTKVVQASISNNELRLNPVSMGDTTVTLMFENILGQKVYADLKVTVSPKGDDWFAALAFPYQVLVGVALGIAVLAIVLFIVWLFIRALSKRKQEENETVAPTSAYIIKLNSQIAAAQAQQRAANVQSVGATTTSTTQTQMLALGAAPTASGAPASDTLALGVAPPPMTSSFASSDTSSVTEDRSTASAPVKDDIYIPLSDDELLERIFIEKYEPRGMARRSFFKSKDLQTRELEKEKARIRDDVRDGMTIEEACKSLSERQAAQNATVMGESEQPSAEPVQENSIITILGFDPESPLVDEPIIEVEETPESLPEEIALKKAENKLARIEKELTVIEERMSKMQTQIDNYKGAVETTESTLALKEESNASLRKSIEDLEFKLATAKSKEKDKLVKDIENKEHVITANKEMISKLQDELSAKRSTLDELNGVLAGYETKRQTSRDNFDKSTAEVEQARDNYAQAQELLEKARKAQETAEKLSRLRPMLETVNTLDAEIRGIGDRVEKDGKEKDTFKAEVSDLQKQMLNTSDIAVVNELSGRMSELNKRVSELDKSIAAANKSKADKTIAFNGERRKANEFIDKEELEVEDVVKEEDDVIGKMAFDEYVRKAQEDRNEAERSLTELQAVYDELVNSYDTEVMNMAVKTAAAVKEAEDALAETKEALDALNAQMETASDDDKLMLSIDQMSLNEKFEQNTQALNELQASAAKEKVEYQINYDNKLEETKKQIEEAQTAYDDASKKVDESVNKIDPLDLILSGSGVISQDRKRMEAENLKKQLELSKSAMEQARLQAKMAQMDAEKAIVDAQRASSESKEEAERMAKEAIAKAEEARLAAEQKAEEEAEKARQEIERAKMEAEEEKRLAAEEAERAKREAEEQAEQARLAAEEEAERARKEAEEQVEQAKKAAEEEAERARKAAEEEAERVRLEAEEEKRKAEEEAEKAKKAAEEEAEEARRKAEAEAEREKEEKLREENRIKEKIEKKKAHILEMRKDLRNITEESVAKDLKEKFYNELMKLDEDEKSTSELADLLNKSMEDADHTAEVLMYKALANKAPKRVVKKVTERINKIPKKKAGAGARPGARPAARPGARPGARPAARPGARPGARPAARPGARPGARPAARPGARPGARPPRPKQ